MVLLTVRNVEINFPFEPYPCQVDYMGKVIECLQKGTNGVLESPTGTGKTLCLLCATLAWRETFIAHMQLGMKMQGTATGQNGGEFYDNLQEGLGNAATGWNSTTADSENKPNAKFDVPKIIYTSRTHSQLSQAISELKNTLYVPKVCVLGSRDQMCINPEVIKQESNIAKVHMCRSKINSKKCHFYNNLDQQGDQNIEISGGITDIEDLVSFGNKNSVCPYYLSKGQKRSADMVFMPYNYLIDVQSRSNNTIDTTNSIVIFDEAHNLEQICEEAVSFDLSSFDIASCIEDLDRCIDMISTIEEEGTLSLEDDSADGGDIDKKEVAYMKGMFLNIEEEIHNILSSDQKGVTKPGSYIFELLDKVKITRSTQNQVVELLEKCSKFLIANATSMKSKHFALSKFCEALKIVFKPEDSSNNQNNIDLSKHYKVHIAPKDDSYSKKTLDVWSTSSLAKGNKGYSLGYWCFSPGESMKDLVRSGVRSIILTSGTLSPLQSFKSELQIDIPVELQNPHVIKKHQICVGIVKSGPDGVALNSSYRNRSSPQYLTSLGNCLVNFARTVPGGLLVFFPSYGVLNSAAKHWQDHGIWARIRQMKEIFVEPRTKGEFVEAMEGFYERIRDPNTKGAAFFAVCRGKVSEGLDFADMNGRAVVITGMPFPPCFDPKVSLKMDYLNEMKNKRTHTGLSGKDWYQQQASRAVNQAVGRVLRHKDDYGAIILCDERFLYSSNISELPKWVQPHIKKFSNFGEVQRYLTQFFRRADQLCESVSSKQVRSKRETGQEAKPAVREIRKSDQPPTENLSTSLVIEQLRNNQIRLNQSAVGEATVLYEKKTNNGDECCSLSGSGKKSKPKDLFDSIKACEVKEKEVPMPVPKSLLDRSPCQPTTTATRTVVRAPAKKKFKIVRSKQKENVEEEVSENVDRVTAIKMYWEKVRKSLDVENLRRFSSAMKDYKQNNDIDSLIQSLSSIFLSEHKDCELFLGFSSYIKSTEHKELFFQKYKDLTGEEIPEKYVKRKREHLAATTTTSKKIRTQS